MTLCKCTLVCVGWGCTFMWTLKLHWLITVNPNLSKHHCFLKVHVQIGEFSDIWNLSVCKALILSPYSIRMLNSTKLKYFNWRDILITKVWDWRCTLWFFQTSQIYGPSVAYLLSSSPQNQYFIVVKKMWSPILLITGNNWTGYLLWWGFPKVQYFTLQWWHCFPL